MRLFALILAASLPFTASAGTLYRVSSFATERSPGELVRVLPGPDLLVLPLPSAMSIGAVDPLSQKLFLVGDHYDPRLRIVDLHDQSVTLTTVDTSALSSCCAWDARTSTLYGLRGGNELVRIDVGTGRLSSAVTLAGRYSMLPGDAARGRAFLRREDSPEVWALDLATLMPARLLSAKVEGAFVDSSDGTLYVSSPDQELFAIDATHRTSHSLLRNLGGTPVAIDAATKQIYVYGNNALWTVDPATGATGPHTTTGGDFSSFVSFGPAMKQRAVR